MFFLLMVALFVLVLGVGAAMLPFAVSRRRKRFSR
jgi:hypothetical protein